MQKSQSAQTVNDRFRAFARWTSTRTGSATAFLGALLVVAVWGVSGPLFAFSDTWQLVINTGTTIVTFLMVFLIQNTQNRDSQAIHTKLDELLVATRGARNSLAIAEELSDEELTDLKGEFEEIAKAEARADPEAPNEETQRATPRQADRAGAGR